MLVELGIDGWSSVAPRAGAWIETSGTTIRVARLMVAPRAGAWIETNDAGMPRRISQVAPRAGAWIETSCCWRCNSMYSASPLARGRGLKLALRVCGRWFRGDVAPRAGAWIETRRSLQL